MTHLQQTSFLDETVEVAVDFLTVTTKTDVASASLIKKLLDLLGTDFLNNSRHKPWSFSGFHGQSYEGVRYGLREAEAIVMLSGERCNTLWREVAPARTKCTRIDLAVTHRMESPNTKLASGLYKQVKEQTARRSSLILNSKGGSTLYVGSRSSQFFGRVYDKGAEEECEPGIFWRWELETKKPVAEPFCARLLDCENVSRETMAQVYHWFESRGVTPLWTVTSAYNAIEIGTTVTTVDKQLIWLKEQVRPTVGRLILAGFEGEAREALGLPLTSYFPLDNRKDGS